MSLHAKFMQRCLDLARKGRGQTSPNPMVGAVIIKNGRILSEGYHHQAGLPHAEINALKKLNFQAKGFTLYCNLEPCFHYGRTPPCVEKVVQSGIRHVVIAHRDPNPLVSGKSVKYLKNNGIKVTEGVLEKEARLLNRTFLTWITQNRPYIILKAAMSLDGKMSNPPLPPFFKGGRTRKGRGGFWITNSQSRKRVHEIRSQVDAILVGVNTVLADNPSLNVRGIKGARQPLRIILDSHLRTPLNAKLFSSVGGAVILATATKNTSNKSRIKKYEKLGALVVPIKSLPDLLKILAQWEVTSLLVEGGPTVLKSFEDQKLWDEVDLFVAPKIIGVSGRGWIPSSPLSFLSLQNHGSDFEIRFGRYI